MRGHVAPRGSSHHTRWTRVAGLAASLCLGVSVHAGAASIVDEHGAETLMQYFTDSDRVMVRSAIGNYALTLKNDAVLSMHWNNEKVVIPAIDAPVGSQEAVDAITTASRPIAGNAFQDFVKTRNEFESGIQRGHATLGYYYSGENDYVGQQVSAGYNRDFTNDQFNLAIGTSYGWDAIDPVHDDDTGAASDSKTTLHGNAVATRVLTPTTLLRAGVEYNVVNGLQHNPYRNVYAGGTRVPERHPEHRERRDAFLKVHQYLPNRSSLKLNYRFYNDDWGIDSHELGGKLSQYVTRGIFASWEYRWYTQTPASFHRDEYTSPDGIDGYRSGDYRMAELASHLFGVALDVDLATLNVSYPVLDRMGLRCNYERYFNSNNYSANILTTQIAWRF